MSAGGPWSVKGIDPKAREIAKDLARRSGMTLGEWINQMILEGDEDEEPQPIRPPERPRPARPFAAAAAAAPTRLSSFSSRGGGYRGGAATAALRQPEPEAEPDELGRVTAALERLTERIESAERRSTLAITGIDQSVAGALARIETAERDGGMTAHRLDEALQALTQSQDAALERLRRVETDDTPRRSAEAMKALEQALSRIASQLYEGETRTQAAIGELREELSGVARRVEQSEQRAVATPEPTPAPVEDTTAAVVDGVVARIAERIETAEGRTAEAMRALEGSFAALDARLHAAETRIAEPAPQAEPDDSRFERLAADLSARVEASRAELAERLNAAADSRLDQIDAAMREMAMHVEAAEHRSADAVDRMGREVLRVAELLGRRVAEAEAKNAEAAERLSAAVDQRLSRSDSAQAEAIERLGTEIARISERLADRIGASERRSSQAIDEVGEQVARVTDKINQRYDRAAAELTDRIKQSEDRTARLLEDARERIDQRIGEVQTRTSAQAAPLQQSLAELASRIDQMEAASPFGPQASFEPPTFTPSAYAAPRASAASSPFEEPAAFTAPPPGPIPPPTLDTAADRRPEEGRPAFDPFADFEADAPAPPEPTEVAEVAPPTAEEAVFTAFLSDAAEPAGPNPFADADAEPLFAEPVVAAAADEVPPPRPLPLGPVRDESTRSRSTREMLESARAAARASADPAPKAGDAPLAARSPMPRLPLGKASATPKPARVGKPAASPLRTALFVSGALAAVSVGAWTFWAMNYGPGGDAEPAADSAPAAARPARPAAAPAPAQPQAEPPAGPAATAAALAGPQPTTPPPAARPSATPTATTAPGAPAAAPVSGAAQFAAAVAQLNGGQRDAGLPALRAAAEGGHAPAQFYLARVYERGQHGVPADAAEARRWTERAARGGETRAMHNLALFYFEGTGGAQNLTQAVSWFRRAADANLVDSQYNLGRMYEQGLGVPQNSAEAYKWYLIAGAGGDGEARASVNRLRASLSAEARSVAERSAAAFRAQRGLSAPAVATATPTAPAAAATATTPAAGDPAVAAAQRGLAQLGYYRGPADGVPSPGLRAAIVAFQRAQGLPVTGQADDALIARMAAAVR